MKLVAPLALALLAVIARPSAARACAPAPPQGEVVRTNREDALIVWDETRRLEHFVRSAVFETSSKSFGFLVPTPSRPLLAEAGERVTAVLASLTKAPIEYEARFFLAPIGCTMLPLWLTQRAGESAREDALAAPSVRVLEQTRVAGLDAAVLEADDPTALADWLRAHGFEFRDALKRWVAPYLAKKWKITAFRYERPDVAPRAPRSVYDDMTTVEPIASRAVRMTFATDVPVYPYLEPDDVPAVPGRELRLFVVSSGRMAGTRVDNGEPWSASLPFSGMPETVLALSAALPGVDLPASLWVNEFSDLATKRPASDLLFRPAVSQTEVRRPPVIAFVNSPIYFPYEIPLVLGGVWWWRRRARLRRAAR